MYNNFRPTGTVVQLIDGRVFKRNQKNLWEDINTGVAINEQQLGMMISSASFSSDASGGGSRRASSAPSVPQMTRLSGTFNDIVLGGPTEGQTNTLSVILGDADPTTPIFIRIITSGTFNGVDGFIHVYKNNTLVVTTSAIGPTSYVVSSPSFITGDLLKIGVETNTGQPFDFNLTVEIGNRNYPQANPILDTFNVSASFGA
jgi:hypothetical protein